MGEVIRWVHIVAGASWLGAVVMVVFVIVPSLIRLDEAERGPFAATVLPRVFRLASIMSLTVVAAGIALYMERFGWRLELEPLVNGRWGWSILVGSSLALLLTAFHFFAEDRLAPHVRVAREEPVDERVLAVLKVAPRVGLGVLVTVIILMAYAGHGL